MATPNGVFDLVANNFRYTLVFAPFHGSNRIKGAMIPADLSRIDEIEGLCDGSDISWVRNMRGDGTTQTYTGHVNEDGESYSGQFTQSHLEGGFVWSAQLAIPPQP